MHPALSPLDPLELCGSQLFGHETGLPPLPGTPRDLHPVAALEQAMLPALHDGPCLVAFSGGRDSSALLAVAVRAARREGLPDPIPLTFRFPAHPGADESSWQELVIRHLDLGEWEIKVIEGELGLLGPTGRSLLQRHGLLWPPHIHAVMPMLEAARNATLIHGHDGDGVFASWHWGDYLDLLAGGRRARPSDLRRSRKIVAPRGLLRRRIMQRMNFGAPWLKPEANDELRRRWAELNAEVPLRWDRRLSWYSSLRMVLIPIAEISMLAAELNTEVCFPFADRRFISALADFGGARGLGTRTTAMRLLFGDLLPDAVLSRTSKAGDDAAYWGSEARAFAEGWDGSGVPDDLVEKAVLRRIWSDPIAPFDSWSLLQAAWLHSQKKRRTG